MMAHTRTDDGRSVAVPFNRRALERLPVKSLLFLASRSYISGKKKGRSLKATLVDFLMDKAGEAE